MSAVSMDSRNDERVFGNYLKLYYLFYEINRLEKTLWHKAEAFFSRIIQESYDVRSFQEIIE